MIGVRIGLRRAFGGARQGVVIDRKIRETNKIELRRAREKYISS